MKTLMILILQEAKEKNWTDQETADKLLDLRPDIKNARQEFIQQASIQALSGCIQAHASGNDHYKHIDIVKDVIDIATKLADKLEIE